MHFCSPQNQTHFLFHVVLFRVQNIQHNSAQCLRSRIRINRVFSNWFLDPSTRLQQALPPLTCFPSPPLLIPGTRRRVRYPCQTSRQKCSTDPWSSRFGSLLRPRSTLWLSRAIRSVAKGNQWSEPMESFEDHLLKNKWNHLTGLPTAGWYLGSVWPSLDNYRGSSWGFGGSWYSDVNKQRLNIHHDCSHYTNTHTIKKRRDKLPTQKMCFKWQPSLYRSIFSGNGIF